MVPQLAHEYAGPATGTDDWRGAWRGGMIGFAFLVRKVGCLAGSLAGKAGQPVHSWVTAPGAGTVLVLLRAGDRDDRLAVVAGS